ncbi:uncharacterized protein PV06_00567 [Exophiala oligosperma]|uniref:Uncharacterized protein n=1 Tax=Exophiala oligosperma TaxID=215243 RepID=A0A0D2DXV7_9EURO|nr:uncharacterized protein PV06_00567 [Exophiala oligosperma]KIW47918.1 hypothetical protein PV06_00567 [Exophiala oligosperma]
MAPVPSTTAPEAIIVWKPSGAKALTKITTATASPTIAGRSPTMDHITDAYRFRYASYLASTFHISLDAAKGEASYQLQPRRASETSESEVYRS